MGEAKPIVFLEVCDVAKKIRIKKRNPKKAAKQSGFLIGPEQ